MVETSAGFAKAIAYCLEYDYWYNTSNPEGLRRFLAGVAPQTGDELFLRRLRDLAHFVSRELPKTDGVDACHTTLQQIHAQAVQLNDPKVALVMGGATKIKQYVFESARLPEIRGASALLDRINLVDVPALFNKRPKDIQHVPQVDRVRQQFAERYEQLPPDCPECVIYANGGEILAFAPVALAQLLADAIEFLYTSETLVANSVAVWKSFSMVELVGGVEPLAFWQRWSEKTYRDHLASLLGKRSVEELLYKKCFGELAPQPTSFDRHVT